MEYAPNIRPRRSTLESFLPTSTQDPWTYLDIQIWFCYAIPNQSNALHSDMKLGGACWGFSLPPLSLLSVHQWSDNEVDHSMLPPPRTVDFVVAFLMHPRRCFLLAFEIGMHSQMSEHNYSSKLSNYSWCLRELWRWVGYRLLTKKRHANSSLRNYTYYTRYHGILIWVTAVTIETTA